MQHADKLVQWLQSYKPNELFNDDGTLKDDIKAIIPKGNKRMSMNPVTNGGSLAKHLEKPNPSDYALDNKDHGTTEG